MGEEEEEEEEGGVAEVIKRVVGEDGAVEEEQVKEMQEEGEVEAVGAGVRAAREAVDEEEDSKAGDRPDCIYECSTHLTSLLTFN